MDHDDVRVIFLLLLAAFNYAAGKMHGRIVCRREIRREADAPGRTDGEARLCSRLLDRT